MKERKVKKKRNKAEEFKDGRKEDNIDFDNKNKKMMQMMIMK